MTNVAVALASQKYKVVAVEGDPAKPLEKLFGIHPSKSRVNLRDVVEQDMSVEEAVFKTKVDNLFIVKSGVRLEDFFEMHPFGFAEKLMSLDCDFLFVDAPYPSGEAAILSLGICQYFIPIITEDDFATCLTGAIDTVDLGLHYLKCVPIGYILNKIKDVEQFDEEFIQKLEDILELRCIAMILEDEDIASSYGKTSGPSKAFIAHRKFPKSQFSQKINDIAKVLAGDLPKPEKAKKTDVLKLLKGKIEVIT